MPGLTIPNPLRPHLCAWAAFFCTASLIACVKGLHGTVPVALIITMRSWIGLLCLYPLVRRQEGWRATLKTRYPKQQILRGCCGIAALSLNFHALPLLPLADAQGISQLYPVFLTVLAPFILGEYAGWRQWLALFTGLGGALLIAQPQGDAALVPMLCVMGASIISAGGDLLARYMGRHDTPLTVTVWLLGILGMATLIWWLIVDGPAPLAAWQIGLLLLIGMVGAGAQLLLAQAFKFLPAVTVGVYSSLGLLWAVLFGMLFFGEMPGWWLAGGAVLILFAAWMASYTRPARAPVAIPPDAGAPETDKPA